MTHTYVDRGQAKSGRWGIDFRDAAAGALVTLLGLGLLVDALSMDVPTGSNQQIGPDVFPLAISVLLTALGVILVVTGLLRRGAEQPGAIPEPHAPEGGSHHLSEDAHFVSDEMHHLVDEVHELMEEERVPFARLLVALGIFVVYLVVYVPLGFILSTALFMLAMTSFVAPEKVVRNALVALGTALVVYFAFSSLLGVELPAGILG